MKRNKALTAIFVAGCIAVVAIAGIVTLFAKDNFGNKTQICDGVSIGSIDVGGLTKEQAQKKVETYIADRQQRFGLNKAKMKIHKYQPVLCRLI